MKKELFNPKLYTKEAALVFPTGKRQLCPNPPEWVLKLRKAAVAACFLLLPLFGTAQNVVLLKNDSTGYVVFRYNADTLDNALFRSYLLLAYTSDTAAAQMIAGNMTRYLLQNPTGVNDLNEAMRRDLLGCCFDDYACYLHIRQKRLTIIRE